MKYSKEQSSRATKTTIKMLLVMNFISMLSMTFMGPEFLQIIVIVNVVLLGVDYLYDLAEDKRGKVSG